MAIPLQDKSACKPRFNDYVFTGPEPKSNVIISSTSDHEYHQAMYWYNYYFDIDQTKEWLIDYMVANNYDPLTIKRVKVAPTWKTSSTAGRIARLLNRGWNLPQESIDYLEESIKLNSQFAVVKSEESTIRKVVSIADKTILKANDTLAKLDGHIDAFNIDINYPFSMYSFLVAETASLAVSNTAETLARSMLVELELKEGYEYLSASQYKKHLVFFRAIEDDCKRYASNNKTVRIGLRKPRKIKEKSAEKLTAKVKYMKEAPELKLVSISPQLIIKAQTLWTYNDKYRQLTVYNAADATGLSVKGTTIMNFDDKTSIQKRLRKPELFLQQVLTGGKITLRKLMDQIKTNPSVPKGRLNEDTILLKVIK